MGISVIGIIFYRASYFGLFDTGKILFLGEKPNLLYVFALGQLVTVSAGMMSSGAEVKLYNGTMDCMTKILKNEGAGAFFKGCGSNVIRGTGGALVLTFYDKLQGMLTNM